MCKKISDDFLKNGLGCSGPKQKGEFMDFVNDVITIFYSLFFEVLLHLEILLL